MILFTQKLKWLFLASAFLCSAMVFAGRSFGSWYPVHSAPEIVCPGDTTVAAGENCAAVVSYHVDVRSDFAPRVTYVFTGSTFAAGDGDGSGSLFNAGTTHVFITATNPDGSVSCSFDIHVNDQTAPVINCLSNTSRNTDDGQCSYKTNGNELDASATDNCAVASLTNNYNNSGTLNGAVFPKGNTTVTWTATDGAGNSSSCSFTVSVRDNRDPFVNCVPNQTRQADPGHCFYTVTGSELDPVNSGDNCPGSMLTNSINGSTTLAGASFGVGTTHVTWTIIDASGNPVSCGFNVTVNGGQSTSPYIVYAKSEANFGENNSINGNIGVTDANGKANFKKFDVLDPYYVKAKNITIQQPATVTHTFATPATDGPSPVFYPFSGNTTGLPDYTVTSSSAIPLTGNYKNLTVKKNVSITITGTLFSTVNIEEGAQVSFAPAGNVINVVNFTVKGNKDLVTKIFFTDTASVRVGNNINIGENDRFNVNGPKVTIYVGDMNPDPENVTINGRNTQFTANIYQKVGVMHVIGANTAASGVFTGWYILDKLHSDPKNISWNNPGCPVLNSFARTQPASEATATVPGAFTKTGSNAGLSVQIAPNPSHTDFGFLINSTGSEAVIITITDISGRLLVKHAEHTPGKQVRLGGDLKPGVYFAEVRQGAAHQMLKLVKLR